VLFGSSTAHVALRRMLIEEHQLDAVVKLPAGVFKPYAGVSTAILIFTKGGRTEHVWYYDVQADGLSLDDKRDPVVENDLPDVCARWAEWKQCGTGVSPEVVAAGVPAGRKAQPGSPPPKGSPAAAATLFDNQEKPASTGDPAAFADRKAKAFAVPADEIRANKYDLSINRYKEVAYEEVKYDPPKTILKRLKKLNEQEAADLAELEGMLK
jgi:type I restriction enzyme M protein